MKYSALIRLGLRSLSEIAYPGICICCHGCLESSEYQLCRICCRTRFAPYYRNDDEAVLPEFILASEALWQFEKRTDLQDLFHSLKFENLYGIGLDIGQELGRYLVSKFGETFSFFDYYPLLVPVPLHRAREKKRGYNQARSIAMGVRQATGWPVADHGFVKRIKKTAPQTGLSIAEREENVRGVFSVDQQACLTRRLPIVIDDVRTTGATTVALAEICLSAGAEKVAIATVAKA